MFWCHFVPGSSGSLGNAGLISSLRRRNFLRATAKRRNQQKWNIGLDMQCLFIDVLWFPASAWKGGIRCCGANFLRHGCTSSFGFHRGSLHCSGFVHLLFWLPRQDSNLDTQSQSRSGYILMPVSTITYKIQNFICYTIGYEIFDLFSFRMAWCQVAGSIRRMANNRLM